MNSDERDLKTLSSEDCYRLLATQQIGRLGVNAEHYPLIFPVNYALDRDIIVRPTPGRAVCTFPTVGSAARR